MMFDAHAASDEIRHHPQARAAIAPWEHILHSPPTQQPMWWQQRRQRQQQQQQRNYSENAMRRRQ
jgi:hypothetical protein